MRRERGPYRYRRLQQLDGASIDPYRPARKPRGPVICIKCRAVFRRGRWSWGPPPAGAARVRCPACRRADEQMPGGILKLGGAYLERHRDDIMALLARNEAMEKTAHPLERIIGAQLDQEGTTVSTTSPHLARRIAHALQRAYKGELSQSYSSDGVLRVRWRREA